MLHFYALGFLWFHWYSREFRIWWYAYCRSSRSSQFSGFCCSRHFHCYGSQLHFSHFAFASLFIFAAAPTHIFDTSCRQFSWWWFYRADITAMLFCLYARCEFSVLSRLVSDGRLLRYYDTVGRFAWYTTIYVSASPHFPAFSFYFTHASCISSYWWHAECRICRSPSSAYGQSHARDRRAYYYIAERCCCLIFLMIYYYSPIYWCFFDISPYGFAPQEPRLTRSNNIQLDVAHATTQHDRFYFFYDSRLYRLSQMMPWNALYAAGRISRNFPFSVCFCFLFIYSSFLSPDTVSLFIYYYVRRYWLMMISFWLLFSDIDMLPSVFQIYDGVTIFRLHIRRPPRHTSRADGSTYRLPASRSAGYRQDMSFSLWRVRWRCSPARARLGRFF